MADAESENVVKLGVVRWSLLTAHINAESSGFRAEDLAQIIVDTPIVIDGITFLPAIYRAA